MTMWWRVNLDRLGFFGFSPRDAAPDRLPAAPVADAFTDPPWRAGRHATPAATSGRGAGGPGEKGGADAA
jgi:hypothetical protein